MARSASMIPVDSAICHFCSRVFAEPERVVNADRICNEIDVGTRLHQHEDEIQFDLMVRCGGTVTHCNTVVPLKRMTAMVSYPGDVHAHATRRISSQSEVLTCRIKVELDWPLVCQRPLPPIVPEFHDVLLVRIMRMVAWLGSVESQRLQGLAALAQALALWPRKKDGCAGVLAQAEDGFHKVLRRIDADLSSPPPISEMAEMAGVSSRQLIRQFRTTMGTTPHQYVTIRRLEYSKRLLSSGRLNVTDVADVLGFPDTHAFSRWFRREAAINPSEYREHPPL